MEIGARETMNGFVWVPHHEEPPPPYDAEVEYISILEGTTGLPYVKIPAEYCAGLGFKVEAYATGNFNPLGYATKDAPDNVYGDWNFLTAANYCVFATNLSSTQRGVSAGKTGRIIWETYTDGNTRTFKITQNGTVIYDYSESYAAWRATKCTWFRLPVFQWNGATTTAGRIYGAKIYCFSTLIHDLVPVRVPTVNATAGALYDRVTGEVYRNQGSGYFRFGKDIKVYRPYDAEVQFVCPWAANSYAETGIWAGASLKIEAGLRYDAWASYGGAFWGCGTAEAENSHRCILRNSNDNGIIITLGNKQGASASHTANSRFKVATWHHIVADDAGKSITLDGQKQTFNLTMGTTPGTDKTLKILTTTGANSATANAKCSYFRIYQSGVLVLDCIPVRVGVYGFMYDKLTGKLLGFNPVGEPFFCGPDRKTSKPYTSQSYIIAGGWIAQWDGIDNAGEDSHDPSATTWKDLKGTGTYDFTLENGASFDKDSLVVPNPINRAAVVSSMIPWESIKTSEIVFDVTAPNPSVLARYIVATFSTKYDNGTNKMDMRMMAWDNNGSGKQGWMPKWSSCNRANTPTANKIPAGRFAIQTTFPASESNNTNPASMHVNGFSYGTTYATDGAANGENMHISQAVGTVGGFLGRVHALRLYSTQLTTSQKMANLAVDQSRFMPSVRDYVQDGLIAQFDGIENAGYGMHTSDKTQLKELVTGQTFTTSIANSSIGDIVVESDALYFTRADFTTTSSNATLYVDIPGLSDIVSVNTTMTIELVMEPDSSYQTSYATQRIGQMISVGNVLRRWWQSGTVNAMFNGRDYYSAAAGKTPNTNATMTWWQRTRHTAMVAAKNSTTSQAIGYIDGTRPSSYTWTDFWAGQTTVSDRISFGTQNVYEAMILPSRVYGWRVYSRALSAAEIAHNYTIDVARYNLPNWQNCLIPQ